MSSNQQAAVLAAAVTPAAQRDGCSSTNISPLHSLMDSATSIGAFVSTCVVLHWSLRFTPVFCFHYAQHGTFLSVSIDFLIVLQRIIGGDCYIDTRVLLYIDTYVMLFYVYYVKLLCYDFASPDLYICNCVVALCRDFSE